MIPRWSKLLLLVIVTMIQIITLACQTTTTEKGDNEENVLVPEEEVQIDLLSRVSRYPDTHPCHPFSDVDLKELEFFSPGYPADTYPNNTRCECILEAPSGSYIKLDFREYFEIEDSIGCKNDYLEVRDGAHGYDNVLYRGCGSHFPPMIRSTDRYLWLQFKSDENIELKGFKAVFDYTKRPAGVPEIIPCVIKRTNLEQGLIGRKDIPNSLISKLIEYDMPIDCVWNITVRENWKVQLQFQKFSLERTNDCVDNFIQVFSGDTDMDSMTKNFCGSMADTVPSEHNTMFVRFYSQSKGNKSYFEANFTAFRKYEKSATNAGKCHKDEFDCEDNTCISSTLKCNDLYNCRFRWDEDGCHNTSSLGFSEDHIIIIMVIFSLILTGMCFTFVFNCVRKLIKDHRTIQEYIRESREQQLNELDKQEQIHTDMIRSHSANSTPSLDSKRYEVPNAIPCYVPGGDVLPPLLRHGDTASPKRESRNHSTVYSVDTEDHPDMCDTACQTRESILSNQVYSTETSPSHSVLTNTSSPQEPFSTFGYKDNKYKAETKIQVGWRTPPLPAEDGIRGRPYSVQTTKSAPDVIVTH